MAQVRSQDETAAPTLETSPCSGRGARYIQRLERYPERDFEPAIIRRARLLVRIVWGLPPRAAGQGEGAGPSKSGGKTG